MTRKFDGAPVARHLVFILQDGAFVVQWDNQHTQDILTGKIHPFNDKEYGHAITDYELEQLREAGRVAHYDRAYIWLHALPEGERFSRFNVREETAGRQRYFYLNTTLPGDFLQTVQQRLHELDLSKRYTAREQNEIVAIMNKDGHPFTRLAEVETAQNILRRAAPQLLKDAAVAFVEYNQRSAPPGDSLDTVDVPDLNTLIASQTQSLADEDRLIIGVDQDEKFLASVAKTMEKMGVEFVPVTTGHEALITIEDLEPDLVLMDLVMPDTHAWQILARMKANQALVKIPVIIVSALGSQSDQVFALTVAKVYDYLIKPISPGQLRKSVWMALKGR
jgi:CheY-like chemotaxis protein